MLFSGKQLEVNPDIKDKQVLRYSVINPRYLYAQKYVFKTQFYIFKYCSPGALFEPSNTRIGHDLLDMEYIGDFRSIYQTVFLLSI